MGMQVMSTSNDYWQVISSLSAINNLLEPSTFVGDIAAARAAVTEVHKVAGTSSDGLGGMLRAVMRERSAKRASSSTNGPSSSRGVQLTTH